MSHPCRIRQKAVAFTLVEVLTVIAIIAILATVVAGSVHGVKQRSGTARARAQLACLAQALEDFKFHYGDYPQTATGNTAENSAAILFGALGDGWGPDGTRRAGGGGPIFVDLSKVTFEFTATTDPQNAVSGSAFLDPWGRRYFYSYPRSTTSRTEYLLFSAGPDGVTTRFFPARNSDDCNADDIVAGEMP